MKNLVYLICFLALPLGLVAQNEVDSLKLLVKKNKKQDSTKVIHYNLLAKNYLNAYPDSIAYFARKASKLAKQVNYTDGLAESYRHLGTYYFFQGDKAKSLASLDSSLTLFKQTGNQRGEMSVYNNRGLINKNTGDFKNAIQDYNLALSGNRNLKDSTGILNNLINLANVHSSLAKYDDTELYFAEALEIAKAINNQAEIANIYSGFGILEERRGNFEDAIKLHKQAIDFYNKTNFSSNIAITYNNIANIERKRGNFITSIRYFKEALEIAEKINRNLLQAILLNNIANNYFELNDYEKAIDFYEQSLAINQKKDLITYYASVTNIAQIKLEKGDYIDAEKLLKDAITFYQNEEIDGELINCYNNIGSLYIATEKLDSAQLYLEKAIELAKHGGHDYYLSATYSNLGNVALLKENYLDAIEYATKSYNLSIELETKQRIASSSKTLAEAYKEIGDFENALLYAERYKDVSDELFNVEKSKELGKIEVEKEFEAEKARIQLQNEKILLERDVKIKERNLIAIISFTALFVMTLVTFILYLFKKREQKNNKKLEKANQDIEEQNERLKALHIQKNKLFSIVAHDLRGPLNTLNGMFELLARGDIDDEELKSIIPDVNKQLESTIVLTNNLLEWASQEMREDKDTKENIDLHSVVEELKVLFTVSLSNKEITFNNFIAEETSILYNKQVLILVLRNLISNAIKYCDQKDKISISGHFIKANNTFKICVTDTGVGMNEEVKNKLFSNKVNSKAGTQNETGTGLGLILSKDFIQQNGGEIWVEFSKPNQGTKICFTIPQ